MEEIKKVLPGFDYDNLTDEQKTAVDEVFRVLSEKYSTLDLTPLRIKFKLEEKKYYNLEDSDFYKECAKNRIVVNTQWYVRNGIGDDAIHYPIISVTGDVRDFDNIFIEYKKSLVNFLNDTTNK